MIGLQEVLSEIKRRRVLCRENNVAPGTANEDAIYRICEEIVSNALAERTRALSQLEAGAEPRAWFVKDYADGWIHFDNEADAMAYRAMSGSALLVAFSPDALASPSPAPEAEPVAVVVVSPQTIERGYDAANKSNRTYVSYEAVTAILQAAAVTATPTPAVDADAVIEAKLQSLAADILALKLHPATSEEYDAGYIAARNDAFAIIQEAADNAS